MFERFPLAGGSYVLILRLENPLEISIGRLGQFGFLAALYVYCGSGLGSGGLRGRLRHHLNSRSSPHWHVDYLRPHCDILEVIFLEGEKRLECSWAQYFLTQPSAFVPAPGFGASDCRNSCPAHLIGFSETQISQILRNFTLAWNCQRLPME